MFFNYFLEIYPRIIDYPSPKIKSRFKVKFKNEKVKTKTKN